MLGGEGPLTFIYKGNHAALHIAMIADEVTIIVFLMGYVWGK